MRTACASFLLLMLAPAAAQGLVDPTRPPGGAGETATVAETSGPVLQSVMLSQGRKVAVISGEMVALGGSYGSSRLVKLTETEAVLKNGSEITVLRMYPLVDKRAAVTKKQGEAGNGLPHNKR